VTRWNPETGRGLSRKSGPRGYVTALAVSGSSDGTAALIVGAEDGTVRRWEDGATGGGTGEPLVVRPMGEEARVPVRGLAVHGNLLAVAFGDPNRDTKPGPAFLLDAVTLETLFTLPEHVRAAECVTFSADGRYVVTGGADEMARLSALGEDGEPQPLGRYAGQARPVNAALAIPTDDGTATFASASGGRAKGGNELRVWRFEPPEAAEAAGDGAADGAADEKEDGAKGKVRDLAAIGDFAAPVRSLALSPDGKLLAVGDDAGAVRMYRVRDLLGEYAPPLQPLIAPKPTPRSEEPASVSDAPEETP